MHLLMKHSLEEARIDWQIFCTEMPGPPQDSNPAHLGRMLSLCVVTTAQ